jgi:outer membrane biosynthesis protein TonB
MSDEGPGSRRSVVEDARVVAATVPEGERERAVAGLVAAHAVGLARDARRHVRAAGVSGTDQVAALRAVTDAQRAVLDDLVAGRRPLEGRAWSPTVRFEALRAVRALAAEGAVVVPPYRHRLAADRAALLLLRESAAVVDRGPAPREVVRTGAVAGGLPPTPHPLDGATATRPLPTSRSAGTASSARTPARRERQRAPVARGRVRSSGPGRPVRWGAAAVLSAATLAFGVVVAPAQDEVGGGPGVSVRPEQVLLGTTPGTGSTAWAPLDGAGAASVRLDLSSPVLTGLAPSTAPAVELVDEPADEPVGPRVDDAVDATADDPGGEPVVEPLPVVVPAAPGPAVPETPAPAPAPASGAAPAPAPAAPPKPAPPAAAKPTPKPTPKPAPAVRPAPTPVPARPGPPVTRPAQPKPDRPAPRSDEARGSSRPGTAKPQPQTRDDRRTDKDAGRQDRGHGGGRDGRGGRG